MADKAIGSTEANEVVDAIEADKVKVELNKLVMADKAVNELNKLVMADEADIADKPAKTDKAEADEAIVIDEADLANKADSADEALVVIDDSNKAGANEANEATDATGADEAYVIDKPSKAD